MKNNVLALTSILVFGLISSCMEHQPNLPANEKTTSQIKTKTALTGKVDFPEFSNTPSLLSSQSGRKGNGLIESIKGPGGELSTKAKVADLIPDTTVAIIYPENHPSAANKTVASGLTDIHGTFIINPDQSFNPSNGEIFVLQASRRFSPETEAEITMRTFVQWTGIGWESITFPGIKLNADTTAMTIVSGNNPSINPIDFINKIDISSDQSSILDINQAINKAKIISVSVLVNDLLRQNQDPIKYINYDGNNYVIINKNDFNFSRAVGDIITFSQINSNSSGRINVVELDNPKPVDLNNYSLVHIYPAGEFLSPDRKKTFFTANEKNGHSNIYSVNSIGGNLVNLTGNITASVLGYVGPSPDRSKIIFTTNNINIYVIDTATGNMTNITASLTGIDSYSNIKFSPDSKKISFTALGLGTNRYDLYIADLENNNALTNVTAGIESGILSQQSTYWSPNSAKIAFKTRTAGNPERTDIYTADASGSNPVKLSSGLGYFNEIFSTCFSPDSSKVAFITQTTLNFPYSNTINIKNADNSGNLIDASNGVSIPSVGSVEWSTNSSAVAYSFSNLSRNFVYITYLSSPTPVNLDPNNAIGTYPGFFSKTADKIIYTSSTGGSYNIYSADLDGGNKTNLTGNLGDSYIPLAPEIMHPERTKYIFVINHNDIYTMNSDGTNITDLNLVQGNGDFMVWSKSGDKIIYRTNEPEGGNDYRIMNSDGSGKTKLTNTPNDRKDYLKSFLKTL